MLCHFKFYGIIKNRFNLTVFGLYRLAYFCVINFILKSVFRYIFNPIFKRNCYI